MPGLVVPLNTTHNNHNNTNTHTNGRHHHHELVDLAVFDFPGVELPAFDINKVPAPVRELIYKARDQATKSDDAGVVERLEFFIRYLGDGKPDWRSLKEHASIAGDVDGDEFYCPYPLCSRSEHARNSKPQCWKKTYDHIRYHFRSLGFGALIGKNVASCLAEGVTLVPSTTVRSRRQATSFTRPRSALIAKRKSPATIGSVVPSDSRPAVKRARSGSITASSPAVIQRSPRQLAASCDSGPRPLAMRVPSRPESRRVSPAVNLSVPTYQSQSHTVAAPMPQQPQQQQQQFARHGAVSSSHMAAQQQQQHHHHHLDQRHHVHHHQAQQHHQPQHQHQHQHHQYAAAMQSQPRQLHLSAPSPPVCHSAHATPASSCPSSPTSPSSVFSEGDLSDELVDFFASEYDINELSPVPFEDFFNEVPVSPISSVPVEPTYFDTGLPDEEAVGVFFGFGAE